MQPITVVSVERTTMPVAIETRDYEKKPRVYLGGELLGQAYELAQYPSEVEVFTIVTSDGQEYRVASHTLPSFTWVDRFEYREPEVWESYRNRWYRKGTRRFQKRINLPGVKLHFRHLRHLRPGAVVGRPHPFRLMAGAVTDHAVSIPLIRPVAYEWMDRREIRFASGVSKQNWILFLRAICGLYFDQALYLENVKKTMKTIRTLRKQKSRVSYIKGQCFDGARCQVVAIGANLLFTGKRAGQEIYIVDSPQYGRALYVFDRREDALAWAERRCSWAEAMELATARIIHTGEWIERVNAAVA